MTSTGATSNCDLWRQPAGIGRAAQRTEAVSPRLSHHRVGVLKRPPDGLLFATPTTAPAPTTAPSPPPWPLADDLGALPHQVHAEDSGAVFGCRPISADELTRLDTFMTTSSPADQVDTWASNATRYQVAIRPRLPDENGCPS